MISKDWSQAEPATSMARSVAQILNEHVTVELEGIDRIGVDGQRATAPRFGQARILAWFQALALFSVQTQRFSNAQLRTHLASTLVVDAGSSTPVA